MSVVFHFLHVFIFTRFVFTEVGNQQVTEGRPFGLVCVHMENTELFQHSPLSHLDESSLDFYSSVCEICTANVFLRVNLFLVFYC